MKFYFFETKTTGYRCPVDQAEAFTFTWSSRTSLLLPLPERAESGWRRESAEERASLAPGKRLSSQKKKQESSELNRSYCTLYQSRYRPRVYNVCCYAPRGTTYHANARTPLPSPSFAAFDPSSSRRVCRSPRRASGCTRTAAASG